VVRQPNLMRRPRILFANAPSGGGESTPPVLCRFFSFD
jgi:hypothetical protein